MKIVFATKNKGKIKEFSDLFRDLDIEILSLDDIKYTDEIPETGNSFEENALQKAKIIAEFSKEIALADDSGLIVDALDGEPGIYSARYGDPDFDDQGRRKYLLENMKNVTDIKDRTARFACALCLYMPSGEKYQVTEYCEGLIDYKESGENGFGYDSIFIYPEMNKSFADISLSEKAKISHRGKAFNKIKKYICDLI